MLFRSGGQVAGGLLAAAREPAWRAQHGRSASYQAQPDPSAFQVDSSWTASRAFRFMRGVRWRGQSFEYRHGADRFIVENALEQRERADDSVQRVDGALLLPFTDGAILARGSKA